MSPITPPNAGQDPTTDERLAQFLRSDYAASIIDDIRARDGDLITSPPMARVHRTTNQTIGSGGGNLVFDVVDYDTNKMVDLATYNTRITINRAGAYLVHGIGWWNGSASNTFREIDVRLNGTTTKIFDDLRHNATAVAGPRHVATAPWEFDVGDYVTLYASQGTGGNLVMQAGSDGSPMLGVTWIGDL